MTRTLFATTAIAGALMIGAAHAQTATTPAPADPAAVTAPVAPVADGRLASDIMGQSVYNGAAENADDIGKVNDMVIGKDGRIASVIVGVGGFLGLGERNVAVDFGRLTWTERNGTRWLVAEGMTKDQLGALPAFDTTPYRPAPAAATNAAGNTAAGTAATGTGAASNTLADNTMPAADGTSSGAAPDATATGAIDRSQLTEVPMGQMAGSDLVGTTVYGANDARIGDINEIVLGSDNKVDAYVIGVGGFLGIGEKSVAVGADNLAFMQDKEGRKYLYTDFSKEQLESQPAYDKSTYASQRDAQRLTVTR